MTDPRLAAALDGLGRALAEASAADLPDAIGALAAEQARALARLTASATAASNEKAPDENLTVAEAARRLSVSKSWLYHHAETLPFTRRLGRALRFSARSLDRWNHQRR